MDHTDITPSAGASKAHEIGSDLKSQLSQAPSSPMDLIYWKDEFGEHSYYTDDLRLIA